MTAAICRRSRRHPAGRSLELASGRIGSHTAGPETCCMSHRFASVRAKARNRVDGFASRRSPVRSRHAPSIEALGFSLVALFALLAISRSDPSGDPLQHDWGRHKDGWDIDGATCRRCGLSLSNAEIASGRYMSWPGCKPSAELEDAQTPEGKAS